MTEDHPAARRAVILGLSVLLSLSALGLALWLGAWAFAYRRHSLHEGRLARMVEARPTVTQVTAGLQNEGMTLVATDAADATLQRLFGASAMLRAVDVRTKRERWPSARVFSNADLVYVVFFRDDGKAADASLFKR
jgi:hypothetical protein